MNQRRLAPVISILFILIFWQILDFFELSNTTLFPAPLQIWRCLLELQSDYLRAFLETLSNSLFSFALSAVLGMTLAIVLSLRQFLRDSFLPVALFFQTVPIIAIAPLLVIYLGYGRQTIIAAATLVSLFPVLANTLLALTSTPQEELELFALYKASSWQVLWMLRIPRGYLGIYGGLRIAAGLAVIGVVAGEFVAGTGLGSLIDSARTQQRIDIVYLALLGLALIGLSFIGLLTLIHSIIQRWRPLAIDVKL
jgi:NitT/TauT family transport system permease protein